MSRMYGSQFTQEVPVTQAAGAMGFLDPIFGTNGSLSLTSVLAGSQAHCVQVLPNGDFLTVLSLSGAASVVALYNAQAVLQTGYGASGLVTLGTSSTSINPQATMLDFENRLLIAGGNSSGTAGWIYRVSTDGQSVTSFSTGTAWQYIAGLGQQ